MFRHRVTAEPEWSSALKMGSGFAIGIGFLAVLIPSAPGWIVEVCCGFGICGYVVAALASSAISFTTQEGKMVLQQDASGQWNWVSDSVETNQQIGRGGAAQYNDQSTQILSRVITEVRNGSNLEDLEPSELDTLAGAYGINGGSKEQKINALTNSKLASKALKLTAVAAAGGIGAMGAAKIVKSGRERAIERAEELRTQGRERLQQGIDTNMQKIDSKLPTNEAGQTASEVAHNVILDQLSNQIREKNLTPELLMELGDLNRDGKLEPIEISGALAKATGLTVPVFIVKDAIKDFDTDGDGTLDSSELHRLWAQLGFELEEETEYSDEEIDAVLDEVDSDVDQVVEESTADVEVTELAEEVPAVEEIEIAQEELPVPEEITEGEVKEAVIATDDTPVGELTEGIDTEFENFILEMEEARFTSERRKLMEKQVTDYLVNIRIQKMERTLIGDPVFRGGQSVHGLIDGGPYVGLVKIPVAFDEMILSHKEGDEIKVRAKLVDFSTSLKRPVLEANELL
jgi:hypothetical protein